MNDFSLIDKQKFVKRAEVVDSKSFIYYYKHMFSVQTIVWGGRMFLKEIKKKFTIACIGGMNVDRKFYAKDSLQYETSNPATSSVSVGGGARNIAENLGRLDERVRLFSVSGEDGDWEMIK